MKKILDIQHMLDNKADPDELYQILEETLQEHYLKVKFYKESGEEREMICTLDMDRVPSFLHPRGGRPVQHKSNEVLSVFDLDRQNWRSFRIDSIQTVELYS